MLLIMKMTVRQPFWMDWRPTGARGRLLIGDGTWFVPWHLDIGTGNTHVTWQGTAGIAYAFNSIDLVLAYRHLYYGAHEDDALVQDLSYSGPAIGAVFRFQS